MYPAGQSFLYHSLAPVFMFLPSGEQRLATILKHDTKTTSYKIALLRAINDVVLLYPATQGQDVAVPLSRLAELWVAYYWPFADAQAPIYQGGLAEGKRTAYATT